MKYSIEDDIDFYGELCKFIEEDNNDDDNDMCLISNTILDDFQVKLNCGHKFNYIPLFKDLCNHKKKFNKMESNNMVKSKEIRCPYCRNRQTELLPFHPELNLPQEHGVNFFDETKNDDTKNDILGYYNNENKCSYKELQVDNSGNVITDLSGNQITNNCNDYGYNRVILKNKFSDNNNYCQKHYYITLSNYKLKLKEKIQSDKKAVKLAEKKAKDEAKLAEKQAKDEAKLAEKQAKDEAKLAEKQAKYEAKLAEKQAKLFEKQTNEETKLTEKEENKLKKKIIKQKVKKNVVISNSINIQNYENEKTL